VFRGWQVPEVLLSGDHAKVAHWRRLMSLWRTWQRRPDLLETADLTPEEQKVVDKFTQGQRPSDVDR
jgi:tRNA (guanine37-N1)-methyltransferase